MSKKSVFMIKLTDKWNRLIDNSCLNKISLPYQVTCSGAPS